MSNAVWGTALGAASVEVLRTHGNCLGLEEFQLTNVLVLPPDSWKFIPWIGPCDRPDNLYVFSEWPIDYPIAPGLALHRSAGWGMPTRSSNICLSGQSLGPIEYR